MTENKYKKINHKQDSQEWKDWRNSGIGGSDVAKIMGSLPMNWGNVLDFWKTKVGLLEDDFVMNEAMQKGKDLEEPARLKYTEITGIKVKPTCFELAQFPFFKVSLDGITKDYKHILEIKCPGLPSFREAKRGVVKPYYYSQIQFQALCSGAETAHYFVYREEDGSVLINVPRNDEYIEELVRRCKIFWNCVEEKTPCLPHMLGIDMSKDSDPYEVGDMTTELIGIYKN